MPTRDEIIERLADERAQLEARYRALPADQLTAPCTEDQSGGAPWSAKDHIAHLTHIERAFNGMIRKALAGEENPVGFEKKPVQDIMAMVHGGNRENVADHRDDDLDALLADFDATRADTLSLIESLTDEQLAAPLPGAPWNDGSIGGVLITNAHHAVQHWAWVEEGLATT
jgi:hypothetical protein